MRHLGAVELRHNDQVNQEHRTQQRFGQETQFFGLLLLLSREGDVYSLRQRVGFHRGLDVGNQLIGIGAFRHAGKQSDYPVAFLPLHGTEGGCLTGRCYRGNGDLLDFARCLIAECNALVQQLIRVVAVVVLQAHVDGVVVLSILKAVNLFSEQRRADGVAHLAGGYAQGAGLGAVDFNGHLRFAGLHVQFQLVDSLEALTLDVGSRPFGSRQNLGVVVAGEFQVDRRAHGGTRRILIYRNNGPGESLHVVAQVVQNHRTQHLATVLIHAEGRLAERHNNLGFVRGFLRGVARSRVARSRAHLGNDGLHHVVVLRAVLGVRILVDHFQYPIFHPLGKCVGFFDVRAYGQFNVDVGQIGFVGRKKDHIGRYHHQQRNAGEQ